MSSEALQIIVGSIVAILTGVGGFWVAIVKSKVSLTEAKVKMQEAFAEEKKVIVNERDSIAKGADTLINTTMKMFDRQDKQIETTHKQIEATQKQMKESQEYYKSRIKGLETNIDLMQGEIKDLQHTYNMSLTQDRVILQKAVEQSTQAIKENNRILLEIKQKAS
jgi:hexokinase